MPWIVRCISFLAILKCRKVFTLESIKYNLCFSEKGKIEVYKIHSLKSNSCGSPGCQRKKWVTSSPKSRWPSQIASENQSINKSSLLLTLAHTTWSAHMLSCSFTNWSAQLIWRQSIYHFEEYPSFKLPKWLSYITNILRQIIMHKSDKNLERYLIFLIWNLQKVGRHSPQNYKVISVKDISGYGILSS